MIQFNVPTEVLKSVKHYRLQSYTRQVANEKNFEHMHAHAEIFFITGGKGYFRTEKQKVKVQIASLKSKISRDYETLGRLYHDVIKNGSENEEAINEIIAEIEDKKQEICGLEEKIGKNDKVKICEKCSWKNPADAVFCNKCGEQL